MTYKETLANIKSFSSSFSLSKCMFSLVQSLEENLVNIKSFYSFLVYLNPDFNLGIFNSHQNILLYSVKLQTAFQVNAGIEAIFLIEVIRSSQPDGHSQGINNLQLSIL